MEKILEQENLYMKQDQNEAEAVSEIIDQLKKKCDPKLYQRILTVLPKILKTKWIVTEYGVTNYWWKKYKILLNPNSKPKSRRSLSMNEAIDVTYSVIL